MRGRSFFFYCYPWKAYGLKTGPHLAPQNRKLAARQKAEAAGKEWPA